MGTDSATVRVKGKEEERNKEIKVKKPQAVCLRFFV